MSRLTTAHLKAAEHRGLLAWLHHGYVKNRMSAFVSYCCSAAPVVDPMYIRSLEFSCMLITLITWPLLMSCSLMISGNLHADTEQLYLDSGVVKVRREGGVIMLVGALLPYLAVDLYLG
jgi:hypothetical protein